MERILDLREVKGAELKEACLAQCSREVIELGLIQLNSKADLKFIPTKPGCYFILSRPSEDVSWEFRNIGTYHGSIRERIRQHCYAEKGKYPHSQKYEIHKSSEYWAVNYRLIEPLELRYFVEEVLIKSISPRDNDKHNSSNKKAKLA